MCHGEFIFSLFLFDGLYASYTLISFLRLGIFPLILKKKNMSLQLWFIFLPMLAVVSGCFVHGFFSYFNIFYWIIHLYLTFNALNSLYHYCILFLRLTSEVPAQISKFFIYKSTSALVFFSDSIPTFISLSTFFTLFSCLYFHGFH